MRARRPPLAEIDAWSLWLSLRRGDWARVRPWLLLLTGLCAVMAGVASFFWLTARNDPFDIAALLVVLVGLAVYLAVRLSSRRAFSVGAVAGLIVMAAAIFAIWLLVFAISGENALFGMTGVLIECGTGIALGLSGINRLDPSKSLSE